MRLQPQQAGRVGEHRLRIRLRETVAVEKAQESLRMAPRHGGVVLSLHRLIAEIAPAIHDLLGRAAADAKLKPPARDQVGRTGILDHVERVFIAHIDNAGADLDL